MARPASKPRRKKKQPPPPQKSMVEELESVLHLASPRLRTAIERVLEQARNKPTA